jgi:hypothetical protein
VTRQILLAFLCAVVVSACSSPASTEQDPGANASTDVPDVLTAEVAFEDTGIAYPDTVEIAITKEVEVAADVPLLQCQPGEGCFLDGCEDNGDCQSGWCVQHLGESVCSQACQEECPPGWSCKQVAGSDPDVVYICVSDYANLCRPCAANSDCTSTGGAEDACLDYGPNGNFCGGPCGDDESCPWGFSCGEAVTVEGTLLKQCLNDTGECPCTGNSVAMGLTTPCSVTNDAGTCKGKRTCAADGLGACDGAVPAEESCNGIDDDCDGETDEPSLVDGNYVNLCDDGNPCTEDKCSGEGGCLNETVDSGGCDDGNPCTVADHCAAGTCIGDPVECDDMNPCTDNVCTETGGCEYPFIDAPCDDGNPCTLVDQCVDGVCNGTEVACDCLKDADCGALEDGDLCNGTLICDTSALPYKCVVDPDTVVACPAPEGENAVCLLAACDPVTGDCTLVPHHEGLLCDDGDACTVKAQCVDGLCTGGFALNCNDGNGCTDDACDAQQGCMHTPNEVPCNDGDVCTTADVCNGGECTGGALLGCDDGNVCNGTESCDLTKGCVGGEPLVCDDGKPCNGLEACDPAKGCIDGISIGCDDGNHCTGDTCDENAGCVFTNLVGTPCDDGSLCTEGEVCSDGNCGSGQVVDCADDNPCTDDTCDPAIGCVSTLNQAVCNDGNICTTDDHCHLGECAGTGQLTCDDGNTCTDDSCDPNVGCQFVPNAAACDDGNACMTGEHCSGGWCAGGGVLDCDDSNLCTDDSCAPETGCVHDPNQVPCDDGNKCTTSDICSEGDCAGVDTSAVDCDDSNECSTDTCEPQAGCKHTTLEDGTDCGIEGLSWCQQGQCVLKAYCGDGIKNGEEQCDDGNEVAGDGCENDCTLSPSGFKEFLEPGSQTFTVPAGVFKVRALAIGGGGSGNRCGGCTGGGGGGGAKSLVDVTPGQTIAVVVGRGGGNTGTNAVHLDGGDSFIAAPVGIQATGGKADGTAGVGSGGNLHNSKGGTGGPEAVVDATMIVGAPGESGDAGGAGAGLNGFTYPYAGDGVGYGGGGGGQNCQSYGGLCDAGEGGENGYAGGEQSHDGGGPSGGKTGNADDNAWFWDNCSPHSYYNGGGGGSFGGGGGNDGSGQGDKACAVGLYLGGDGAHGYVRFEWGN